MQILPISIINNYTLSTKKTTKMLAFNGYIKPSLTNNTATQSPKLSLKAIFAAALLSATSILTACGGSSPSSTSPEIEESSSSEQLLSSNSNISSSSLTSSNNSNQSSSSNGIVINSSSSQPLSSGNKNNSSSSNNEIASSNSNQVSSSSVKTISSSSAISSSSSQIQNLSSSGNSSAIISSSSTTVSSSSSVLQSANSSSSINSSSSNIASPSSSSVQNSSSSVTSSPINTEMLNMLKSLGLTSIVSTSAKLKNIEYYDENSDTKNKLVLNQSESSSAEIVFDGTSVAQSTATTNYVRFKITQPANNEIIIKKYATSDGKFPTVTSTWKNYTTNSAYILNRAFNCLDKYSLNSDDSLKKLVASLCSESSTSLNATASTGDAYSVNSISTIIE